MFRSVDIRIAEAFKIFRIQPGKVACKIIFDVDAYRCKHRQVKLFGFSGESFAVINKEFTFADNTRIS